MVAFAIMNRIFWKMANLLWVNFAVSCDVSPGVTPVVFRPVFRRLVCKLVRVRS